MALLFISHVDSPDDWTRAFAKLMPELEVRAWPNIGRTDEIEVALVWRPPRESLLGLPNLKLIASLGAGVDHLLRDTLLPDGVPVTRFVDDDLTAMMREYAVLHVLACHRRLPEYLELQRNGQWVELPQPLARERKIGIMGLGVLGGAAATRLAGFGFDVAGYSRSAKSLKGVTVFAGRDQLKPFLARTEILVNLLPLTPDTESLIDREALAALPKGASFINLGRGGHVVEADLAAALDSGQIKAAILDVFRKEPLPAESPFWRHPRVIVTPHVASITNPESGARKIIENLKRIRQGLAPLNRVDPTIGY
ncbi:MAG: glyoxylate/hydroxypyruvate reductase A [Alphaproteobacteria bacterium]|nr:glyoxylate/hydroxypyruvate reductase A [Alphaproteobacteria bacterium]